MKTNIRVKLNEEEFRKIVKEELTRETTKQRLINEGYEPEIIEELLQLQEIGWRDIKALMNTAGGSAKKAKDILSKKASELGSSAMAQANSAIDKLDQAGSDVSNKASEFGGDIARKAGEMKSDVNKSFQASYRESFASDLDKVFSGIEKKYFNDKVLAKSGFDEQEMTSLRDRVQELKQQFSEFFKSF